MTQCIKDGCKPLAAKLSTMEDEAMAMNKILKGRQLVWLVHDWFRFNPEMKQVHGLQAITDLQWYGDDKIPEFMDMWKLVATNNSFVMTEPQKAVILVEKMARIRERFEDSIQGGRIPFRAYEVRLAGLEADLRDTLSDYFKK